MDGDKRSRKRASTWTVEVPEYVPEDDPILYEALDLVGKAIFGRRWRGAERYNLQYDRRIEGNLENVREAQRQAVRKYLPCRKATKKLRDFLVGDVPDHRNAVPATFFGDDGLMIPIKAQDWGVDDTLKLFRTPRINYDKESCKFVPLSTKWSTKKRDIIEGRIFVLRRALESRLPSAGHPEPITRQHATIATERRCRRWLEQQMREGNPTKTKKQYLAEAHARFGVGPTAFKRRIWGNAITNTKADRWSDRDRNRDRTG